MAIDVANETIITAAQFSRRYGKHISWAYRQFLKRGCEYVVLGGRIHTSVEAVQRWADRLTAAHARPENPAVRSPASRSKALERAERELDRLGV